ncbi:hypothetical protein OG302_17760 [Streptomyces sp. NBC_01283]|uniref:hypothetical protein n=1 Tax=Streptomyces sp. NBC_01283 TaxID=2903812 RepID=UPI00352CD10D|nr:hypothetical protein OG302_17760 [Streptomyces sp. NBC_01283]
MAEKDEIPDGAVDGAAGGMPDDVWERFERDSLRDIRASAPKEPSARARMVAERLRRLDEEAARRQAADSRALGRRRRKRKAARGEGAAGAWRPDEWRAAPTGPRRGARSERSRRVWSVVIVVGGMALAIVLLSPFRFWMWQ